MLDPKGRISFFVRVRLPAPEPGPHSLQPRVVQMGKKNKDEAPKPNNVLNRDILQRLNFLYQASVYMESISRQCNRGPALEGSSEDNSECLVDGLSTQPIPRSSVLTSAGTIMTPLSKASGRKRPQEQRKRRVIHASDIGQGYVRAMRMIGQKATVKM